MQDVITRTPGVHNMQRKKLLLALFFQLTWLPDYDMFPNNGSQVMVRAASIQEFKQWVATCFRWLRVLG